MKNALTIAVAALLFFSCKKKGDHDTVPPETKKYAQISVNPTDPLILKVFRKDGIEVSYFGEKESNGKPKTLDLVSILKPNQTTPTLLSYSAGKPKKVLYPDGASIELIWLSEEEVRMIAITADGKAQVSVPFKIKEPVTAKTSNKTSIEPRTGRLSISTKLISRSNVSELNTIQTSAVNTISQTAIASAISVNVMKCDKPFNKATVVMNYFNEKNESLGILYGSSIVNGVSKVNVPDPSDKVQFSDLCNAVSSTLGAACYSESFFSSNQAAICTILSGSIDAVIFGPTGEAIPIFAACEGILNSFSLACNTLNAGPEGSDETLLSNLCKYSEVAPEIPKSYTFRPIVYVDGEEPTFGEKTTYTYGQSSYPSLTVKLKGVPKLQDFTTYPIDPAPKESYNAKVQVYCALAGSVATISVIGTDGYTKSLTVTLPAGDSEINLTVPGAVGGVQDRLKVEVQGIGVMYASIVF